ncbi:Rho1 guanine nucleotide exchange factor TUS1 [Spathaspora sp. JA1]|nr:Rho1 guanine nucleotide exchange factor TUS1 [Spathaspora sp. JA1]
MSSNTPTSGKRSLRRKPPSDLEPVMQSTPPTVPTISMNPIQETQAQLPKQEERYSSINNSPQGPGQQQKYQFINYDISKPVDYSQIEMSYDDSFISVDSPLKPRGPREIWEYENPVQIEKSPSPNSKIESEQRQITRDRSPIQINRTKSRERSFQEISRSKSIPSVSSPPYPTEAVEEQIFDEDFSFNAIETNNKTTAPSLIQRRSLPILPSSTSTATSPYPINNNLLTPSLDRGYESRDFNRRTSPSRTQAARLSTYAVREEEESSQPYQEPRRDSSEGEEYSTINEYSQVDLDDNEFVASQGGSSRWNSVHSRESYYAVTDNPFFDEEELDVRTESPTSDYFDYSILPDIPNEKEKESVPPTVARPMPRIPHTVPLIPTLPHKELPVIPLDLPELPFSSSMLLGEHFQICENIWSLSSIFQWCLKLRSWSQNQIITKRELKKALIRLLAFHRSDFALDVITRHAILALNNLVNSGALVLVANENKVPKEKEDEVVIMISDSYVNGVLPSLTSCYSIFPHVEDEGPFQCYSSSCYSNEVRNYEAKIKTTNIKDIVLENDWATHWHLTAEDLRGIDQGLIKRQSYVFDLLRYEQTFIQRAKCFIEIVVPELVPHMRELFKPEITRKFEQDVVEPGRKIVDIHQNQLFEPLLKILVAEGKFIRDLVSISNIYNEWAIEVRSYLMQYMSCMPLIEELLSTPSLKTWVDNHIGNLKRVKELKVNVAILFISTFNSRYQQLPLQLLDIRKKYDESDEEYCALTKASETIKKLGLKINESKRMADNVHTIGTIKNQLVWKNNLQPTNLNLGSSNRKFICRGDMSRKGEMKFTTWLNHIILLDNYMIITDRIKNSKTRGYSYRIIEDPIPVEFLIVEEKAVASSTTINSIPRNGAGQLPTAPSTATTSTTLNTLGDDDETATFALKIRYAGRLKHTYTFSCKSERERGEWIKFLTDTKSALSKRLKPSEPFDVKLVSNTCFAYEFPNRVVKLQICAPYDPIYDSCQDSLNKMRQLGYKSDIYNFDNWRNHVVFSRINYLCSFAYQGGRYHFIGLATGLYCCEAKSRWKKILNGTDFTKIHVDTTTGLVIVLGDKHLRYFLLSQLVLVYSEKKSDVTCIPVSKEPVLFFSVGRHKNIPMLFYAKRKSNGTTHFKVLIPETDNHGVFSRFKEERKFYIQAECYGISIFNSSFAVHTNKGFEILELDKLIPRSVPDLPLPEADSKKKLDQFQRKPSNSSNMTVEVIRKLVSSSNVKPLGMFKLNNNTEFLLAYNEFAIFINKHGKLSRFSLLMFDFKAKSIQFSNNYLFLICEEIIEIWSISDFVKGTNKLMQVITGKDIRSISDDQPAIAMANPTVPGLQLALQLVPKPGE